MKLLKLLLLSLAVTGQAVAQEHKVTDAFEDLKTTGEIESASSEMTVAATDEAVAALVAEKPASGYFCFTEDRMHDIRLFDRLPARWIARPAGERNLFRGGCRPGEFYVWQIGVYAPYEALDSLTLSFSDMRGTGGSKIEASAVRCFNTGGTGSDGVKFAKRVDVPRGGVQPLWIGIDVPESASGEYRGSVTVRPAGGKPTEVAVVLEVGGEPIASHGDDEGWRKSRLRWLDSEIAQSDDPTAPYTDIKVEGNDVSWLGGRLTLAESGLPSQIVTRYDRSNRIDTAAVNRILAGDMNFVIETEQGVERLRPIAGKSRSSYNAGRMKWTAVQRSKNFEVTLDGTLAFDGLSEYKIEVRALKDVAVRDIRLEVPYTAYAAEYAMGLGRKGGRRADSLFAWKWNEDRHQDKIWMGNVNAGLNFCFKAEDYRRPLVNVYYKYGKVRVPSSWGNDGNGGITISPETDGQVLLTAYSGARRMKKGERSSFDFSMLVTPVKPLDIETLATVRFYHSNSDLSSSYIPKASEAGANAINIHHKKDINPFINYPYYDESVGDLKNFIDSAHARDIDVCLYYTTRELTIKVPEIWALRTLGDEIIHDGPGRDARTVTNRKGPNQWLIDNLVDHFIPAWHNAFKEGKYAGQLDLSVITTPDSRWNNYYLEGLDWMVRNIGLDGVYIDDSALDNNTLKRARRILDADGKRRLIDIHSWNHMNGYAGYANSLHLYLELLPYVDRTWIGEGFGDNNPTDFWLVEMSGIPFGLYSEMLNAYNVYRGMVFGMLSRLPWSGNPTAMWKLWDDFGMKDAVMRGYWDERNPVSTGRTDLPATVYINGDRALAVIANWTKEAIKTDVVIDAGKLGFTPSSVEVFTVEKPDRSPVGGIESADGKITLKSTDVAGSKGVFLWLEK